MAIALREIVARTPIDHQTAPLLDAVRAYHAQHTLSFTVPGHKCGRGLAPETAAALGREGFVNDIPLAGGADDLHLTRGVLEQAQVLAADAFGAAHSFFLVGGSSLTNQVLLQAVAAPDEEIIVARNAHKSVLAGLVLSGARPVYVHPRHDAALDVAHGVTPADLATTLAAHPQARAVVLVSPTYFGVAADLPALSTVCQQANVPLVVDEAWGAHFPFHPALPLSAMAAGADAGIASLHKVLTAFSQASLLTLQGTRLDPVRVAGWVNLLQTTSPSALILASMDACRRQMVLQV